ncbi:MAG: hypothetical protein ACK5LJ_06675 [Paracoccus sp. (in: a-proteobacteria)]
MPQLPPPGFRSRACRSPESALSAGNLARENLAYQEAETTRQQTLTNRGVGSDTALQLAQHQLEQARQAVIAAKVGVQNALAALGGRPDAPANSLPPARRSFR